MSAAAVRTVHVNRVPVTSSAKAPPPPIPVRRIHSLPDRTVSEQSQLDDILTDLLNDPLFVDGSKTFEFSNDADGTYGTISANYGSITTAHSPRRGRQQLPGFGQSPTGGGTISSGGSGGGRTVVSWQTNHTGPKRTVTVSRQTVNRPIGESAVEFTSMKKVEAESSARPPSPPVRRRLVSAPDSSASLQQHTTSSSSTWREEKRVQAGRRQQQQQPWRHPTDVSHSDTEDYFRSSTSGGGRRWPKPSYEDPYLSDDMAPYFNQLQHSTSRSATSSRTGRPSAVPPKARVFDLESPSPSTVTYETKRSFFISGIERPANTTRQTKYTFSVSPQRSIVDDDVDAVNQHHGLQKPPPIPPQPRALSPNLPPFPVLPPLRGNSSREAVLRVHATRDQTSSQWENGHSRSPSLDDLEKSLQSVQLLLDTQQTAVKQKPPEPAPVDEMVSLVQRQPNQQSQPPVEIEEEIISLRPIGPGVQNLEPEDPSRFRSMTPAFPTQQRVVSPFPTSPTASQSQQFLGYSATSPADVRPPTNLSPQSPVTPAAVPVSRPPASTPAANEPNVANDIDAFAALMDMEATSTPVIQQQQQSAPQRPDQLQPQRVERNFSSPQQSAVQNVNAIDGQLNQNSVQLSPTSADAIYQTPRRVTDYGGTSVSSATSTPVVTGYTSNVESQTWLQQKQFQQQQQKQQQHQIPGGPPGQVTVGYGFGQQSPQQEVIQRQVAGHQHSAPPQVLQTGNLQQPLSGSNTLQKEITTTVQYNSHDGQGPPTTWSTWSPATQPIVVQDFSNRPRTDEQSSTLTRNGGGGGDVDAVFESTLTKSHQSRQQQQSSGSLPRGGSSGGLLTVTSRTTSSDAARTYADRQRSVSPSDMALRARLQSRLETRSPGLLAQSGGATSPSVYAGNSRTNSLTSLNDGDVLLNSPRFVRDTSKYWHKPHITREDAINLLKDKPAGWFVVRNSNTFQGAFGLALKVAQLPPNIHTKEGVDPQTELVRHFLIEPTSKGVRLKGCSNEPEFGSLAALIYQHTITPLALPCKLVLPEVDIAEIDAVDASTTGTLVKTQLYQQGAACNVLYIGSVDMESLTGPEALSRAITKIFPSGSQAAPPSTTVVHFKVSSQGITLTDNKHRLFFRRHYPVNTVTFCGVDTKDRRWTLKLDDNQTIDCKVFGFVARKPNSNSENACHVFGEMDPNQPANAIVNFLTKVMIGQGHFMKT